MANVQGTYTNFPQGFANGVSVRGMPLLQTNPGQVFFLGNGPVTLVNQRGGSDSNRGTFLDPFATLAHALAVCVQARGDIIFVLPGHNETIGNATTLVLNTAGVAIIGLGSGSFRPTFTLNTATTANIPLQAANMSIQNCLFQGNFLSIASLFTAASASATGVIASNASAPLTGLLTVSGSVTGTIIPGMSIAGTNVVPGTVVLSQQSGTTGGVGVYVVNNPTAVASTTITYGTREFALDNNEFRDLSSVLGFLSVFTDSGTANTCDGFSFTRNSIYSLSTVSPTVPLSFSAGHDRISLMDNQGVSKITAVTQGPMLMAAGANNMTNFLCARNKMTRPNTSSTLPCAISTSGTAWTGMAWDNYFGAVPTGTGIWINTGSGIQFVNNYSQITGAADKSALINPSAV